MSVLDGKRIGGAASARITVDGRPYINFSGAGYLALSDIPEIRGAVREALDGGAPFFQHVPAALGGHDPIFAEAERWAARAGGSEAGVYFASGYLIGAVALAALQRSFDVILLDEIAHYNLQDAAKTAGVPVLTFAHADPDSLRSTLRSQLKRGQRPLLMTDGVFATSGRLAPLNTYAEILESSQGQLLVDESHAFGVVGRHGRGAAEYCNVEAVTLRGATLGKAFCAQGAMLGCTVEQAQIVRTVSPVRGACPGSPLSAVAATAALKYVESRPELRLQVASNANYLRELLRELGLNIIDSPAPIVSFIEGERSDMQRLHQELWSQGIFVTHSTYIGAGPHGTLRCAVYRDHSQDDLETLAHSLGNALKKRPRDRA